MSNSSAFIRCVRLDASVIELLAAVADDFGLTESITVEKLILSRAQALGLVTDESPAVALVKLLEAVGQILDKNTTLKADPDVTLRVFERIKDSPRLRRLHAAALVPPSRDLPPEKRSQFVHQRIGRFVKDHLGLVPAEFTKPPEGSGSLVRNYTRLKKPQTAR